MGNAAFAAPLSRSARTVPLAAAASACMPRRFLWLDGGSQSDTSDNFAGCAKCVREAARVFCGGEHTLLRDPETLVLYQLGACGLGFDHEDGNTGGGRAYVTRVPIPAPASAVFPGYYHNFIKLVGGRCYSYGCGRQNPNDGQLMNQGLQEDTTPVPTEMRFAEAVAGGHHSICRTREGTIWAVGAGWQGQMGNGSLRYKNPEALQVADLPPIHRLATGYYHSAALADDNEWYVWGCNEQQQLAPSSSKAHLKQPTRLSSLFPELKDKNVVSVDGGYGHTVLLLDNGKVLTMGNHSEGQRGLDPDIDEPPAISAVPGLPGPVDAIAAGSHHTLAVVGGRVFSFGSDEFGQVRGNGDSGDDDEQRVWMPCEVPGLPPDDPVVRVSAGICHSAAQTSSGRVFLWGCGGNGQTGDASLPTSSKVVEVSISDIMSRCAAKE